MTYVLASGRTLCNLWHHDVLFDIMMYFFDVMTYFLTCFFDVTMYLLTSWHNIWRYDIFVDVVTYFLHNNVLYNDMMCPLTSWHTFWRHGVHAILYDVKTYFLTLWRTSKGIARLCILWILGIYLYIVCETGEICPKAVAGFPPTWKTWRNIVVREKFRELFVLLKVKKNQIVFGICLICDIDIDFIFNFR